MARLVRDLNHSGNAKFHFGTIPMFGLGFKLGMDDFRNELILPTSPPQINRNGPLWEADSFNFSH